MKDYTYKGYTFRATGTTTTKHIANAAGFHHEELRPLYEIDGLKERGMRPFLTTVKEVKDYIDGI